MRYVQTVLAALTACLVALATIVTAPAAASAQAQVQSEGQQPIVIRLDRDTTDLPPISALYPMIRWDQDSAHHVHVTFITGAFVRPWEHTIDSMVGPMVQQTMQEIACLDSASVNPMLTTEANSYHKSLDLVRQAAAVKLATRSCNRQIRNVKYHIVQLFSPQLPERAQAPDGTAAWHKVGYAGLTTGDAGSVTHGGFGGDKDILAGQMHDEKIIARLAIADKYHTAAQRNEAVHMAQQKQCGIPNVVQGEAVRSNRGVDREMSNVSIELERGEVYKEADCRLSDGSLYTFFYICTNPGDKLQAAVFEFDFDVEKIDDRDISKLALQTPLAPTDSSKLQRRGSVTLAVHKKSNFDSTFTFHLHGAGIGAFDTTFTIQVKNGGGTFQIRGINPGHYNVTEDVPPNDWTQTKNTCRMMNLVSGSSFSCEIENHKTERKVTVSVHHGFPWGIIAAVGVGIGAWCAIDHFGHAAHGLCANPQPTKPVGTPITRFSIHRIGGNGDGFSLSTALPDLPDLSQVHSPATPVAAMMSPLWTPNGTQPQLRNNVAGMLAKLPPMNITVLRIPIGFSHIQ